jgi:hypothetical protein
VPFPVFSPETVVDSENIPEEIAPETGASKTAQARKGDGPIRLMSRVIGSELANDPSYIGAFMRLNGKNVLAGRDYIIPYSSQIEKSDYAIGVDRLTDDNLAAETVAWQARINNEDEEWYKSQNTLIKSPHPMIRNSTINCHDTIRAGASSNLIADFKELLWGEPEGYKRDEMDYSNKNMTKKVTVETWDNHTVTTTYTSGSYGDLTYKGFSAGVIGSSTRVDTESKYLAGLISQKFTRELYIGKVGIQGGYSDGQVALGGEVSGAGIVTGLTTSLNIGSYQIQLIGVDAHLSHTPIAAKVAAGYNSTDGLYYTAKVGFFAGAGATIKLPSWKKSINPNIGYNASGGSKK